MVWEIRTWSHTQVRRLQLGGRPPRLSNHLGKSCCLCCCLLACTTALACQHGSACLEAAVSSAVVNSRARVTERPALMLRVAHSLRRADLPTAMILIATCTPLHMCMG